jgi:hypothetical protein
MRCSLRVDNFYKSSLFVDEKDRRLMIPAGRPKTDEELRGLITRMSVENPLWGAPRIHGELLKLGIVAAQSTVAKYMKRQRRRPPSQGWQTFPRNHFPDMAAMDFFVVPTLSFDLLYAFIIVRLDRRALRFDRVETKIDENQRPSCQFSKEPAIN